MAMKMGVVLPKQANCVILKKTLSHFTKRKDIKRWENQLPQKYLRYRGERLRLKTYASDNDLYEIDLACIINCGAERKIDFNG